MTQRFPYDWVRTVMPELLGLDEIPLLGSPPAFPWEELGRQLATALHCEEIQITPGLLQWREPQAFTEALASPVIPLTCVASGTPGAIFWIMAQSDIALLMAKLLDSESTAIDSVLCDLAYVKGFYSFLALQLLHFLAAQRFDKGIAYTLQEAGPLPEQAALCQDVQITVQGVTATGRLLITAPFRKAWAARYALEPQELLKRSSLAEQLHVQVHLEMGKVALTQKQWRAVALGDVIVLDSCLAQPDFSKTKVLLTIGGIFFLRARLKKGSLKILESPAMQEVGESMREYSGESEEESGDDYVNEAEDEYEECFEETPFEENTNEQQQPESHEHEERDAAASVEQEANRQQQFVRVEEIPLQITVEVGRVQMSVQQLVALQPGNIIELDMDFAKGVDLVVSGRKIARGELLKIGDQFGVRILECG